MSIMSKKLKQLFVDKQSKLCNDFELDMVPDRFVRLVSYKSVFLLFLKSTFFASK